MPIWRTPLIQALYTAASGIALGRRQLDAAANNVANASTPGFERSEVVGVADPAGGVTPTVVPGVDDGIAADLVQTILAKHTVKANAAMFRRANAVAGELIDLIG